MRGLELSVYYTYATETRLALSFSAEGTLLLSSLMASAGSEGCIVECVVVCRKMVRINAPTFQVLQRSLKLSGLTGDEKKLEELAYKGTKIVEKKEVKCREINFHGVDLCPRN